MRGRAWGPKSYWKRKGSKSQAHKISQVQKISHAQKFLLSMQDRKQRNQTSRDARTVWSLYEGYMDFRHMFLKAKRIGSASRVPNFPEPVSEQMVCFLLQRLRGWDVRWDPAMPGDLQWQDSRLEVKCVSSAGPITFGPHEEWEKLYILEHMILRERTRGRPHKTRVCCWEIDARHDDALWNVVKVSKHCSFSQQRDQGKRPHITLERLKEQVPMHKVFEGTPREAIFGP